MRVLNWAPVYPGITKLLFYITIDLSSSSNSPLLFNLDLLLYNLP